jgi:hypothetical protein
MLKWTLTRLNLKLWFQQIGVETLSDISRELTDPQLAIIFLLNMLTTIYTFENGIKS